MEIFHSEMALEFKCRVSKTELIQFIQSLIIISHIQARFVTVPYYLPRLQLMIALIRNFSKKLQKTSRGVSINTVVEPEQVVNYLIEFLESLNLPGIASHKVTLIYNLLVILLRNMDTAKCLRWNKDNCQEYGSSLHESRDLYWSKKEERGF